MHAQPGDSIRVVDGPYTGWEGKVSTVAQDHTLITVVIPVFAKLTAIELRPSQIAQI